jgi:hypothetical protein
MQVPTAGRSPVAHRSENLATTTPIVVAAARRWRSHELLPNDFNNMPRLMITQTNIIVTRFAFELAPHVFVTDTAFKSVGMIYRLLRRLHI